MADLLKYPFLLDDAQNKQEVIVMFCRAEVWYSGRAEAYLPMGDRLIIIKEDGTLLVHQSTGNAPINYMKAGARHSMQMDGAYLFLNSRHLDFKDFLDAKIESVHSFHSRRLEDGQDLQITGTEKDMSDMLYNEPHRLEVGFKPVSREEQTKYGFVDVFGYDKQGKLVVVECKRYTATLDAVQQLRRYVEKIESSKGITGVRGILASPKITPNALLMLQNLGYTWVMVEPPRYLERLKKQQKSLMEF